MNKYTELSDFEINKKVAARYYQNKDFIEAYKDVEKVFVDGNLFDPCNNPADAMTIIIENGISMVRVNNAWSARQFNNHCIEINGDNYYRIAMEAYLLMKDA
ncbi:phage protein NinX family protein [Providencia rettgeri]|uniref:phage protein NinX family protein n=1 Tax=Providencia rettgeri TaxID=587 RepID=UPI000BD7FCD3|nr:phage protein NinX family protein [Providencia rettgeri]PCQ38168.1 recombinase [Providencia rettgeri]